MAFVKKDKRVRDYPGKEYFPPKKPIIRWEDETIFVKEISTEMLSSNDLAQLQQEFKEKTLDDNIDSSDDFFEDEDDI